MAKNKRSKDIERDFEMQKSLEMSIRKYATSGKSIGEICQLTGASEREVKKVSKLMWV